MEMVPMPGTRGRQRRRLSRAIGSSVSDPFLTHEGAHRHRRAKPAFGDTSPNEVPLSIHSNYHPPTLNTTNPQVVSNKLDNYLYFNQVASSRRPRRRRLNRDNPAVDLGGFCSHGCCCMQCVRTQEVGIEEDCGKFRQVVPPGLYCLCSWPFTSISGRMSLRIQQLDVVCETKTKDNVFVRVQVSVQYRVLVERSYDAYYRLSDPSIQIKSYAFDVIRSTVPQMTIDEAFVSKSQIADTIMERLFCLMKEYGYEILAALVTNLMPDEKVKMSMNEIEAAKRLKEAIPHQAEAEKTKVVKKAEASAEAMYLSGVGVANARMALAKGMKASMIDLKQQGNSMTSPEVMNLLLLTQYLDTLTAVQADDLIVRATPNEVFDIRESLPA